MAQKDSNPPTEFQFDPSQPPTSLVGMEYHLNGVKEHSATRAAFCVLVTERVRRLETGEKKIVVDLLFKEAFEKLIAGKTLECGGCGEMLAWGDFINSPFELTHNSDKCRSLRVRNNLLQKRQELCQELKGVTIASVNMLKSAENCAGMHPADENPQRDPGLDYRRRELKETICKYDAAIEMHRLGEYGTCADCGETIDSARLIVAPDASQCVSCKTATEELEKIPGKNGRLVPVKRLDRHRYERI